jgi:hypothetical protein
VSLYTLFGLTLDSEIELPELPSSNGLPDVTIRRCSVPKTDRHSAIDDQYVFSAGFGAFRITGGKQILVDETASLAPECLRLLLLGVVMAQLLQQRGWLTLHSSGVEVAGNAVLFLGPVGAGKSTTAAAFHSRGYTLVTDDVAPVWAERGVCRVQPGHSRLRLLDNSRFLLGPDIRGEFQFDKYTCDVAAGRTFPMSRRVLKRIYLLVSEDGPCRVESIGPAAAAVLLSRHSFLTQRLPTPELLNAHLRKCAGVANLIPVRRLIRPQVLDTISDVIGAVEADLDSTGF